MSRTETRTERREGVQENVRCGRYGTHGNATGHCAQHPGSACVPQITVKAYTYNVDVCTDCGAGIEEEPGLSLEHWETCPRYDWAAAAAREVDDEEVRGS